MNFRQPIVYDHHMTFQNKRTYASKLLKTGLVETVHYEFSSTVCLKKSEPFQIQISYNVL